MASVLLSLVHPPQVAAYQSVIDLYKLRWIDFDIEGGAVAQPASIDLRNRALRRIQASGGRAAHPRTVSSTHAQGRTLSSKREPPGQAGEGAQPAGRAAWLAAASSSLPPPLHFRSPPRWGAPSWHVLCRPPACRDASARWLSVSYPPCLLPALQAANPGLTLSYTLPVLPAGLTAAGVALLANAVQRGVRVDVLNIMTMDYGDSAAPSECAWLPPCPPAVPLPACCAPCVARQSSGWAAADPNPRPNESNASFVHFCPCRADPDGKMGDYAIQAAQNTYQQALGVKMSTKVGPSARCAAAMAAAASAPAPCLRRRGLGCPEMH